MFIVSIFISKFPLKWPAEILKVPFGECFLYVTGA